MRPARNVLKSFVIKLIYLFTNPNHWVYLNPVSSTHGGRSWASALRGSSVLSRTRQPPLPFFPHFRPLIIAIQVIRRNQAAAAIWQLEQDQRAAMGGGKSAKSGNEPDYF